ncbi:hypothetical protein [uncultured Eudoraea sp.]|uniref:hypothetical protein n=1 Tax=uncultured Eudoraea sp. TaxID=1035614 RepID=UPI0026362C08|nr:hypothetical protein [uncultured Eudoraea sp.]
MKNLKLFGYLMVIASALLCVQCTSDPVPGPAGADGIDGINGIDGVDGVDGSAASCIACHANEKRDPIIEAWSGAKHAIGGSWARGTSSRCAECHNNEGFIDFIETGAVNENGYTVSNPLNCNGCHDSHRSFDFETDGNDYAVRTLEAVPLRFLDNIDYTIDYGNASNTCANCHQPRRDAPLANLEGKFLQTSTHWGPHHGPQTALLEGLLGAYSTFTLVEDIPATQEHPHRQGASCIDCHMRETTDGSSGHTWTPAGNNCATCHPGVPFEELKVMDDLIADWETLGGILETVVGQAVIEDSTAVGGYIPLFEADGITPVPVVGIVIKEGDEWEPQVGLFDLKDAEAAWNFLYFYEDKSDGVHNPKYAKSIIKNSLAAMQE